jgi:hypothetical protein
METLFSFCAALDRRRVGYDLKTVRDGAVMVGVVIPGEYVEVEFFVDGTIEIERFVSQGVQGATSAEVDQLLDALSS